MGTYGLVFEYLAAACLRSDIIETTREKKAGREKKKKIVICQNKLYAKTPNLCRSGSEAISPIPTTIPMMQMFDFVTLNDIHVVMVWQLLLVFSAFSLRN